MFKLFDRLDGLGVANNDEDVEDGWSFLFLHIPIHYISSRILQPIAPNIILQITSMDTYLEMFPHLLMNPIY